MWTTIFQCSRLSHVPVNSICYSTDQYKDWRDKRSKKYINFRLALSVPENALDACNLSSLYIVQCPCSMPGLSKSILFPPCFFNDSLGTGPLEEYCYPSKFSLVS